MVPDDRELFLGETDFPVILSRLQKEDSFFVDFRMEISGGIQEYQMKFHADRDEKGKLIGFVAGCHCIVSETRNSLSFKKSAIDTVKELLPAAFWYEELYGNGRIKSIHFSDEMRAMLGYTKAEFPDELEALVSHIHPEDRGVMMKAAIDAGTGKTDGYDVEYRIRRADGKYMWVNATGRRIRNDHGMVEGMYGAFVDISDRKIKERDMEIISGLTSEYNGVYYINLETGDVEPYSVANGESKTEDAFDGRVPYRDAYRLWLEANVCDEDKERMRSAGAIGNILKELRNSKNFRTVYRDKNRKIL